MAEALGKMDGVTFNLRQAYELARNALVAAAGDWGTQVFEACFILSGCKLCGTWPAGGGGWYYIASERCSGLLSKRTHNTDSNATWVCPYVANKYVPKTQYPYQLVSTSGIRDGEDGPALGHPAAFYGGHSPKAEAAPNRQMAILELGAVPQVHWGGGEARHTPDTVRRHRTRHPRLRTRPLQ